MIAEKTSLTVKPILQQTDPDLSATLVEYSCLLGEIDTWFDRCLKAHPGDIACGKGCSGCCRGLFDITILDGAFLNSGFRTLPGKEQKRLRAAAETRLERIRSLWPEYDRPYTLNHRPEEEINILLESDNDSGCLLLGGQGECLLYDFRPMTCRLHGLPLLDISGEVVEEEWCTENFRGVNPLEMTDLAAPFADMFRREAALLRLFASKLLGTTIGELDTLIPMALLIDYDAFDWRRWFAGCRLRT